MHKGKVVAGASVVAVGLVFFLIVVYGRIAYDCYEISQKFERTFELNACDYGSGFYVITVLSAIMLAFGSWVLVFGLKSLSLVTYKS